MRCSRTVGLGLALALALSFLCYNVPALADSLVSAGSACSDSSHYSSSFDCSKAFEQTSYPPSSGDSTSWAAGAGQTHAQWLTVDLGAPYHVGSFLLWNGCTPLGCDGGGDVGAGQYTLTIDGTLFGTYCDDVIDVCGGFDSDHKCHGEDTLSRCNVPGSPIGRVWTIQQTEDTSNLWHVMEWQLFGVVGTPSTLVPVPSYASIQKGHSFAWTFDGTDSSGHDISETGHVSYTTSVPSGALSGCAWSSGVLVCTASGAVGLYTVQWSDTFGNTAFSGVSITGAPTAFSISPASCRVPASGGTCTFHNVSTDASGSDISSTDPWSFSTVPSGVACGSPYSGPSTNYQQCWPTAAGSYSLVATDGAFHTFTVHLSTQAAANPGGCGATDFGCWVSSLYQALIGLPQSIASAIGEFLFGGTLNRQLVSAALLPTVSCRAGQPADAPDGVHCWPLPLSVPFDVSQLVAAAVDVSPVAPTLDAHFYVPPVVDRHVTIDPTIVLTPTIMGYVYDVELVLFTIALVYGTLRLWEWVQAAMNQ